MGCIPLLFYWYWDSEPGKRHFQPVQVFSYGKLSVIPFPAFLQSSIFHANVCACMRHMQLMFLWLDKTRFRQNMWPVPVVAVWHCLKNSRHLRICLCLDIHFDVENIFFKKKSCITNYLSSNSGDSWMNAKENREPAGQICVCQNLFSVQRNVCDLIEPK